MPWIAARDILYEGRQLKPGDYVADAVKRSLRETRKVKWVDKLPEPLDEEIVDEPEEELAPVEPVAEVVEEPILEPVPMSEEITSPGVKAIGGVVEVGEDLKPFELPDSAPLTDAQVSEIIEASSKLEADTVKPLAKPEPKKPSTKKTQKRGQSKKRR